MRFENRIVITTSTLLLLSYKKSTTTTEENFFFFFFFLVVNIGCGVPTHFLFSFNVLTLLILTFTHNDRQYEISHILRILMLSLNTLIEKKRQLFYLLIQSFRGSRKKKNYIIQPTILRFLPLNRTGKKKWGGGGVMKPKKIT